jgi:hypothetical protein
VSSVGVGKAVVGGGAVVVVVEARVETVDPVTERVDLVLEAELSDADSRVPTTTAPAITRIATMIAT